ncbi:MAG TPA: carbamate kinase [Thermoplasmata archaeon]|nr:carbamate kinase [Thermoplasmata archaeon]
MSRVVVALGGNALNRAGGDGSWTEAAGQMRRTAPALASLVAEGHELIVTHGNGPQVGQLLRQNELAQREVPPRPLDVLGAQSQGEIGYLIQQELSAALSAEGVPRTVLALVSRMEVSARDPAFRSPTKPIGRYYSETEARVLRKREGWHMVFDGPRGGWRRVVPSPRPVKWLEADAVRSLLTPDWGKRIVPVVSGGGGIPVVHRKGHARTGVEAVIDKDRSAALIAEALSAEMLAMVTDVPAAAVGFGKPWEKWVGEISAEELQGYLTRGEFAEGSMAPKVEAGLSFLAGGGRSFTICDAPSLLRGVRGEAGTRVRRP